MKSFNDQSKSKNDINKSIDVINRKNSVNLSFIYNNKSNKSLTDSKFAFNS